MAATTSRGLQRTGNATRSRLATPTIGTRSAWAMALAGGDADPQAGEQARAHVDGHAADLVEVDAGLVAQEVDRRAPAISAWRLPRLEWTEAEHALVAADGAADLHGRGGDAEDQHGAPTLGRRRRAARRASGGASAHGAIACSSDTWRRAQRRPTARSTRRRVVVGRRRADAEGRAAPRGSRWAATGRMASPHSMSTTPPSSSSSARPEVGDLAAAGRGGRRRGGARRSRPSYCWASVNVGLVIGSVTPRPRAEALGERGLARPEVARQQHEVARLGQRGQPRPARVVVSSDRGRAGHER